MAGALDTIPLEPNPNFRIVPGDGERDNKARWVHGFPEERFPYAGLARLAHLLRVLSAAFSTLAIALTVAAARRLHLPPDLSTAHITILLGLYDRHTGARLPVQGADAVPAEGWIQLGDVPWQP